MEIQDRTFLITGGGSGLGAATARALAEGGASVVIADLNRDAGEAVVAEIGSRSRFAPTDVAVASVQGKSTVPLHTYAALEARVLVNNLPAGPIKVSLSWPQSPGEPKREPLVDVGLGNHLTVDDGGGFHDGRHGRTEDLRIARQAKSARAVRLGGAGVGCILCRSGRGDGQRNRCRGGRTR